MGLEHLASLEPHGLPSRGNYSVRHQVLPSEAVDLEYRVLG
jgi:hypothetical protein